MPKCSQKATKCCKKIEMLTTSSEILAKSFELLTKNINTGINVITTKFNATEFIYFINIFKWHSGRFQAAVTSYQGQIWVVGGCDAWNPLRTVEIYDPTSNTWTNGPTLSTPRRGCGLAVRKGNGNYKELIIGVAIIFWYFSLICLQIFWIL